MSLGNVAIRSMASLSADDVSALVQAATDAAKAASDAVTALRETQASRASGGGFQEASKVVRQPEPFGSENHKDDLSEWQDFNVNFKAWLYYGNPKFELDLHRVEVTHADTPIAMLMGRRRRSKIDVRSATVSSQDC